MMSVGFTMKISFCFENPRKLLKSICLHVCFGRCVDPRLAQNIIGRFCTHFPKNFILRQNRRKKVIFKILRLTPVLAKIFLIRCSVYILKVELWSPFGEPISKSGSRCTQTRYNEHFDMAIYVHEG